MIRFHQGLKTLLLALLFFAISSQSMLAAPGPEMQGALNNLVTPKLVNETNKQQYADRFNIQELIDPQTGSLTLKETDLILPGRDGLDLNMTRLYNSSQAEVGRKWVSISACNPVIYEYYAIMYVVNTTTGYVYEAGYIGPYESDQAARTAGIQLMASNTIYGHYTVHQVQKNCFVNNIAPLSYTQERYNLGNGWSFGFPSVEVRQDSAEKQLYYHDGTGASYYVNFSPWANGNLENYEGKDVLFENDYTGTYTSNNEVSKYIFTDASKTKSFFSLDGRLLGIKDRYGNEIKFTYTNQVVSGYTRSLISQITDSIGRVVTFNYNNGVIGQINGQPVTTDQIRIDVQDPNDVNRKIQMTYSKLIDQINGRSQPKLWRVTAAPNKPEETNVYYDYSAQPSRFKYNDKNFASGASTIYVMALNKKTYSNTTTSYAYEPVPRNLGNDGLYEAIRVTSRLDRARKVNYDLNPAVVYEGTQDLNKVNYTYLGDISGYPTYTTTPPTTYEYGSESVIATNGLKTRQTYNYQNQLLSTVTTALNGEKKVITNLLYDVRFKTKPMRTEMAEFASDGVTVNKLYVDQTYYDWGGLRTATLPLSLIQVNDELIKSKYTTRYQYHDTITSLLLSKQWYQKESDTVPTAESYTYESAPVKLGRILSQTNAIGEVTSYSYVLNSHNQVEKATITKNLENNKQAKTEVTYGPNGTVAFPTESRTFYTNENGAQTTQSSKTYDLLWGTVTSETNNDGSLMTYVYDNLGRTTSVTYPNSIGKDGHTYTRKDIFEYNHNAWNSSFDSSNRHAITTAVRSYTRNTNVNTQEQQVFSDQTVYYDGFGNGIYHQLWDDQRETWIQEGQYHYDSLSRAIYARDSVGNESRVEYDGWGRLHETYDAFGNLYKSEFDTINRKQTSYMVAQANVASFQQASNPLYMSNTLKENVLETTLDSYGRVIGRWASPTYPDRTNGIQETYTYDLQSNLLTYTDPKAYQTVFTYDKLNRLVKVTDALNQNTVYAYNMLGSLKSTTHTDGTQNWVRTSDYDERGLLTKKTDQALKIETYQTNQLGQAVGKTDRNQTLFANQYDQLGRLTISSGGNSSFKTTYGINPFGPEKVEERSGQTLLRSSAFSYNHRGQLASKSMSNEGYTQSTGFQYHMDGSLASVSDPFNYTTQYKYDHNRINTVQTNGSAVVSTNEEDNAKYDYNANGTLQSVTYPKLADGTYVKAVYEYDKINRLKSVLNKKGNTILSEYHYLYDNNSNIESITDASGTTTYEYDRLNRLTVINRPNGTKVVYTYDVRGNRTTLRDDTYPVETDEVTTEFNIWNQLTVYTKGTHTTSFQYEPAGLRAKKITPTKTVRYAYDGNGRVISESDATNNVTSNYVWGPDRLLVKQDAAISEQFYYLYNGHGDVVQIMNEQGQIQNSYTYDEWGNMVNKTESIPNEFTYAGEIFDEETGLYYLRARYYNPSVGRFISEDSYEGQVVDPLSLNLYTYTANNPLMYTDPTGHCFRGECKWAFDKLQSWGDAVGEIFTKGGEGAIEIADFLIVDDINTLLDPNSSSFDKSLAAAGFVPVGKVIKGGKLIIKLANKSGQVVERAVRATDKSVEAAKDIGKACNCFIAGTKVLTDEGEKPIEEIEVGDKVLAKSDETGEVAYKVVVGLFQKQAGEIYSVYIGDEIIEATGEHPFWLDGKGWTFVKDLKVGYLLVSSDGTKLAIDKIEKEPREATVYNFEVADFHSYFVSNLGIWVHNCALKNVYKSIKDSPLYPQGFSVAKNGTVKNKVNNTELLEELRAIESGTWNKIYKDGMDANGNKISVHYFQSQSGQVFNVKTKNGWSNSSSQMP
jgi:RHS repeat-associated protein